MSYNVVLYGKGKDVNYPHYEAQCDWLTGAYLDWPRLEAGLAGGE